MGGIDGMVHEKIVTLLLLCAKQKTWGLEEVKRRVQGGLGTFDLVELGERWNGCEVDVGKKKEVAGGGGGGGGGASGLLKNANSKVNVKEKAEKEGVGGKQNSFEKIKVKYLRLLNIFPSSIRKALKTEFGLNC